MKRSERDVKAMLREKVLKDQLDIFKPLDKSALDSEIRINLGIDNDPTDTTIYESRR